VVSHHFFPTILKKLSVSVVNPFTIDRYLVKLIPIFHCNTTCSPKEFLRIKVKEKQLRPGSLDGSITFFGKLLKKKKNCA